MRIHFCLFDKECRSYDAPRRIYLHDVFGWSFILGERSQPWNRKDGYYNTKRWRFFTWHPTRNRSGSER